MWFKDAIFFIILDYITLSFTLWRRMYKFSIPFVWIFSHSCGVRYIHYMLSYVFSYGVMLLYLLIKVYVGSLCYLHLQSVVQRCYILYYFRLYNLKLYLMETYIQVFNSFCVDIFSQLWSKIYALYVILCFLLWCHASLFIN